MQTLASYALSRTFPDRQSASMFMEEVDAEVDAWLKSKGADIPGRDGGFRSRNPNGAGSVTKDRVESQSGAFTKVCLEEFSGETEIFSTTIYTAIADNCVNFYCALQIEGLEAGIIRSRAAPRCPTIVRKVAALSPRWVVNGSELPPPLTSACNERAGTSLSNEILSPDRRMPILVVARTEQDAELWPDIASELSYELFGLAKVFLLSNEASYSLSERDSGTSAIDCYDGAIRLYWPVSDGVTPSQLWTQRQLLSRDKDGRGRNRIKRDIKELVMPAASISNPLPPIVGRIASDARANEVAELERSASETVVLKGRVNVLQAEKEDLARKLSEAEQRVFELSTKLKYQATYQAPPSPDDDESSNDPSYSEPQGGETRFYKKVADKGSHDLLRPFKDCGHNSWQNSAGADKARKGVEKLEGRADWRNMWHCGSCTGGGVWKVRW